MVRPNSQRESYKTTKHSQQKHVLCKQPLLSIYHAICTISFTVQICQPSVLSYVMFSRGTAEGGVGGTQRILTAAWADRWRGECHHCVPDRWAHRARCPNRCCRVDPMDSPAVPDDCSTAVAVPRPAWMMMRPTHRWLHYLRLHQIGDCCEVAPLAVPVAAAAVQLRFRIQLSAVAAVGRRPRPIHLIVLLTHPNDPTFLYFTNRFLIFGSSILFSECTRRIFVYCVVLVCVFVCVFGVARGTTVVVVDEVVVSDRRGQIRFNCIGWGGWNEK